MAKLIIKDLPENTELDRKAMRTIVGGAAPACMGIRSGAVSISGRARCSNRVEIGRRLNAVDP
ncbi:hypothetical protein [Marinobacterium aestuariivivens]|uniref:Uncharacterized protein n=1 Tax=Marinobacterium aestuariivivens TaxID=1698799 RepID=A0ABW2A6A3_9GAMM